MTASKTTRSAPPKPKKKKPGSTRKRALPAARKRRSAEDILDRIVQAAAEEFARGGYSGATTAAIARRAEVTEAQLFRCFGSKSELFLETIFKPLDQHFLDFIDAHLPEIQDPSTIRERTHLYTTELQHFIRKHSRMLISLVVAQTYDEGTAHGVGKINSLSTYFDRAAGMMATRLKGQSDTEVQVMARLAFASVLASVMFRDWIFPAGLAREEEIDAAVNAFVMKGVASDPAAN
jgi:AcrR family transcriptional regulator